MDSKDGSKYVKQNGKKHSKWWWNLYHLWAGYCLKMYFEFSGLSQLLLGSLKGSDKSSSLGHAGISGFMIVGTLALGFFLSRSLIKAIDRGSEKSKGRSFVKAILPIGYLAGAAFFAMVTASSLSQSSSEPSISETNTLGMAPVTTLASVQSSEGVTEADFDQVSLENFESWIVEEMLRIGKNHFTEKGFNPIDLKPKVEAKSVYLIAEGKKLAIVKVNVENSIRSVTIMGIKGGELYRVGCIRRSNHDIPVFSGSCGNKVEEVFGVSIRP